MTDPRYIKPLSANVTDDERTWLVKLMEECAELQQAAAKVLRHGWLNYNPDALPHCSNEEQLSREIADVDEAVAKIYALHHVPERSESR